MATHGEGTSSSSYMCQEGSSQQDDVGGALLTAHAALVFVAAAILGGLVGFLTHLSVGNAAAAVLAGLTAGGVSAPVLHRLIGP